jgi:xanthine dehydrogenase accessory factor
VAELFACTSNNWIGEFSVSTSIYQQFTDYIRDETPVALATIIEGPGVGAKLLVARVDGVEKVIGSLGHPELDRVVARDTAG